MPPGIISIIIIGGTMVHSSTAIVPRSYQGQLYQVIDKEEEKKYLV